MNLFELISGLTPVDPAKLAAYTQAMEAALPQMQYEHGQRLALAEEARRRILIPPRWASGWPVNLQLGDL